MRKQDVGKLRISNVEEKQLQKALESEFTIINALTANLLGTIVIFLTLFMLNAVLLNKFEVIPQQSFEDFVRERVEGYELQDLNGENNIVGELIGNLIILLMQVVLDALYYILYDVSKTQIFAVASIIAVVNVGAIILVYSIIYRKEVPKKTLYISLFVGLIISMLLLNLIAFLVLALALNPLLLGYFGWWVFLPSTTVSIPILIEWITGVPWIVFWYVFAFLLSTICSITVFIVNRISHPIARNEKLDLKIEKSKTELKDDNWTWIVIATIVGGIITVVWKLFGKLIVIFFYDDLTQFQVFIVYVIIITIGYFVAFMTSYHFYRQARGSKSWVELYKVRHPSKAEQFWRWFTYTMLMSFYWMYSMYIPQNVILGEDYVISIGFAMLITFLSVIAGKLATLTKKK